MRYIAKPGTYFDEGTEATLIHDYSEGGGPVGVFRGTRTCDSEIEAEFYSTEIGQRYNTKQLVCFEEFKVEE